MNPLKLETLSLREVINKKGLCSDTTDMMVPRMRQELEQLAKLPGDYEVVTEESKVTRTDGREVNNNDWQRVTRDGEIISITCGAGPVWRVVMGGLAMCHVSCVMCHVSRVTCHVSPVTCQMSKQNKDVFYKKKK